VPCERAKFLRTIAEKHTSRERLANQFTNPEGNVLIKMYNKKRCNLQNEIVKALMTLRLQFSRFGEARNLALFFDTVEDVKSSNPPLKVFPVHGWLF